ncbi:MAG: NADH-quinone oxidoreductase subunit NuoE [Acetomicrobium sp.]|uniref:NADH-quinone oxidoreductase subunit NuoE n=1 Tax=Acetomicrobium TaxID=49894 RepID=UPI0026ED4F5D|nr:MULTISPECIES: NADH-quinone oxidoreductase subunit NuoE [Acetomicrobium]MDI9377078.1 NADH-quinone oxidoreductase subunit NuoE [Synergistota bacterium]MDR9769204.1 NADH-quinone oxidoreductase subunit NuoE [Acetomicrobium sp.]HOB10524.1 NADH-quinone oxidoreductase subunit NuoE [Acetomicrobium sp.]HQC88450.1 NADH-quinone oxidoreductase subunit NuoE [Acetomicrobium sp.]
MLTVEQGNEQVLQNIIESFRGKKGITISLLSKIQDTFGYLPQEAMSKVARELDISEASLYGVATFYAMFRFNPPGKYTIKLCRGTACHVQGSLLIAQEVVRHLGISEGDTTDDGLFTLQPVACLGCCGLAPVMMVEDKVYGRLTPDKAIQVLENYRKD